MVILIEEYKLFLMDPLRINGTCPKCVFWKSKVGPKKMSCVLDTNFKSVSHWQFTLFHATFFCNLLRSMDRIYSYNMNSWMMCIGLVNGLQKLVPDTKCKKVWFFWLIFFFFEWFWCKIIDLVGLAAISRPKKCH